MQFDKKYSFLISRNRTDELKKLHREVRLSRKFESIIIFRSPEAQLKHAPYKVKRRRGRPTTTDYHSARSDFSPYQTNTESVLPEAAPFNKRIYSHTHGKQPSPVDRISGLPTPQTFSVSLEYFRENTENFELDFVFVTVDVSEFFTLNAFSQRRFLNTVKTALLERLNNSVNFIGYSYPRYLSEDGVFIACLPRKLIIDEWLHSLNTISFSVKSLFIDIAPTVELHPVTESPALLAVPKPHFSCSEESISPVSLAGETAVSNLKLLDICSADVEYLPYISLNSGLPVFFRALPCINLPDSKISYDICSVFSTSLAADKLQEIYSLFERRLCSRLSSELKNGPVKHIALSLPKELFDESFLPRLTDLIQNMAKLCSAMHIPFSSVVFGVDISVLEKAVSCPLIAELLALISSYRFSIAAENLTIGFSLNLLDKFGVTYVELLTSEIAEHSDPLSFVRLIQSMGITVLLIGKTPHSFLTAKDIFSSLLIRLHNTKQF
ncbi:MAG: hypothetical protein IJF27_02615 [Oscillospiraceae bacterium]|nr:hypothetical protein [Oscillospiraceae bacterium]